jgi:hypothetical protein
VDEVDLLDDVIDRWPPTMSPERLVEPAGPDADFIRPPTRAAASEPNEVEIVPSFQRVSQIRHRVGEVLERTIEIEGDAQSTH